MVNFKKLAEKYLQNQLWSHFSFHFLAVIILVFVVKFTNMQPISQNYRKKYKGYYYVGLFCFNQPLTCMKFGLYLQFP